VPLFIKDQKLAFTEQDLAEALKIDLGYSTGRCRLLRERFLKPAGDEISTGDGVMVKFSLNKRYLCLYLESRKAWLASSSPYRAIDGKDIPLLEELAQYFGDFRKEGKYLVCDPIDWKNINQYAPHFVVAMKQARARNALILGEGRKARFSIEPQIFSRALEIALKDIGVEQIKAALGPEFSQTDFGGYGINCIGIDTDKTGKSYFTANFNVRFPGFDCYKTIPLTFRANETSGFVFPGEGDTGTHYLRGMLSHIFGPFAMSGCRKFDLSRIWDRFIPSLYYVRERI